MNSLNALHVPIQRNQFKDFSILREKLVIIGYSLIFVKGESYLIELSQNTSEDSYRKAISLIKEFSNESGYFEGENVKIDVYQKLWNVKIPNLIYNSLFFNIRKKKPKIKIDIRKKRIFAPNSSFNDDGLRIKVFKVDESNFAVSVDYFKSIPSTELSDPRKLYKPKFRKEKIEQLISLIFDDLQIFNFYLGGNKLSLSLKGRNL